MKPTVYLAGPITGLTFDGCTNWRDYATRRLARFNIIGVSPMRAKDFLRDAGNLEGAYNDWPLSTAKGITTRDRMDCTRSNLVLMNLLGADRVSVGTMIEVGWADAARNPIIVAMEPGNVHEHPMVSDCAGYIVPTLDEAINLAVSILSHLTVDLGIRAGEAA